MIRQFKEKTAIYRRQLRQNDAKKRLTSLFIDLPIACILVIYSLKSRGFYINARLR